MKNNLVVPVSECREWGHDSEWMSLRPWDCTRPEYQPNWPRDKVYGRPFPIDHKLYRDSAIAFRRWDNDFPIKPIPRQWETDLVDSLWWSEFELPVFPGDVIEILFRGSWRMEEISVTTGEPIKVPVTALRTMFRNGTPMSSSTRQWIRGDTVFATVVEKRLNPLADNRRQQAPVWLHLLIEDNLYRCELLDSDTTSRLNVNYSSRGESEYAEMYPLVFFLVSGSALGNAERKKLDMELIPGRTSFLKVLKATTTTEDSGGRK